ncbi:MULTISPECIES: hypothetical protein [Streptomyces]|uniref:hypothetical protein n=1 Tax=Streptomyces TaxID=1883 RepID=UPI0016776617|nr:hypothetical protein [Streptomyces roseolus]GGR37082.1 hypothetical protein GCM10010282_32060 [Streptomyces roseolus]
MLIQHAFENGVLHVHLVQDLEVHNRAAAAVHIEQLLITHRPRTLRLQLPTATPSPASLSALARTRRLCESLGVGLSVVSSASLAPPAAA